MKSKDTTMYIILSFTGTYLSRLIKFYMHDPYAHISISFDKELLKMYSFGRTNPYNPFSGKYVEEGKNIGTFKRFNKTICEVYALSISNKQYEIIMKKINNIKNANPPYKFNRMGLFATAIKKKITKKRSFYCAEFIDYLFREAKIENNLPLLVRPIHFKDIPGVKLVYSGLLRNY